MKVPDKCPVCGGELHIKTVCCDSCNTQFTNDYQPGRLSVLNDGQVQFVLTFLACEGNIKDMERALGISYPTVKARLQEIQRTLGIEQKEDRKLDILNKIAEGQLTVDEALEMLKETRQ